MEDLLNLVIVGTFILLLVVDAVRPARSLPTVRRWRLTGIAFFVANVAVSLFLPLVWGELLWEYRLFDLSRLGTVAGAIVGALVLDLAIFAWHFTMHRSSFLWRWFHQVHHSAERIDTAGAFYFSPLDMVGFAFVTSFALVWLLGLSPEAALIAAFISTVLSIFQHANVKTPVWLGYVIQRPEAHALHHGREVHAFNYGNIVWWDMLAGTWRNPVTFPAKAGLFDGSTYLLGDMLLGRDIAAEHAAAERARHWTPERGFRRIAA